jgi:membrane-anchored protein YejM (alkaline phosphatase superfamily)
LDHELKKLFAGLAPEQHKRSLAWVLLGDHGEEFWEHGSFGHFDRRTTGMRARSAFAMHFPTMKTSQRVHLAHHVDIFPTLFSLIGLDLPYAHFSDGSPLTHKRRSPFVHVNTYSFPRYQPFTLITDRHQWLLRRDRSFHLHLDAVLDLFDRPLAAVPQKEFAALLQQWTKDVSRFYPKDTTFLHSKTHITPIPQPFLRPLPKQRAPNATPWP